MGRVSLSLHERDWSVKLATNSPWSQGANDEVAMHKLGGMSEVRGSGTPVGRHRQGDMDTEEDAARALPARTLRGTR
jgi:hypothetical protein